MIDCRQQAPAEIRKQRFLLFGLATAAVVSEALYLTLVRFDAIDGLRPVATFVGLMMALFAVYGIAFLLLNKIRLQKKAALLIAILGSVCFRITMIPAGLPPDASTTEMLELVRADLHGTSVSFDRYLLCDEDIWRYLWDGHVWANSVNPFLYAPVDQRLKPLVASDATTERTWQDIHDNINHPRIPTIYPRLAQLIFRISHAIAWTAESRCLSTALVLAEDGMRETASFTVPPLHRTPTTQRLRSWHSVIDHETHSCKPLSTTSNALLRPSRHPGALRGQPLPSPHTGAQLLCCGARWLILLISSTSKTTARLRWSVWR